MIVIGYENKLVFFCFILLESEIRSCEVVLIDKRCNDLDESIYPGGSRIEFVIAYYCHNIPNKQTLYAPTSMATKVYRRVSV